METLKKGRGGGTGRDLPVNKQFVDYLLKLIDDLQISKTQVKEIFGLPDATLSDWKTKLETECEIKVKSGKLADVCRGIYEVSRKKPRDLPLPAVTGRAVEFLLRGEVDPKQYRKEILVIGAAAAAALLVAVAIVVWWGNSPLPMPEPELTVRSFRVHSFTEGEDKHIELGELGKDRFRTRLNDVVEVKAEFSEPAYALLLAFNPTDKVDEREQLWLPKDTGARPEPQEQLTSSRIRLDDGVGLQAFVLVVSRRPLPAYAEWRQQCPAVVWKRAKATSGFVWRGDGRNLNLVLDRHDARGTEVSHEEQALLEGLGRQLRSAPGVEAVAVVAFAVDRGD